MYGGGHERIRPGTENIPGIVGLGKACSIASQNLQGDAHKLINLRDIFIDAVLADNEDSYLNGHRTKRLPIMLILDLMRIEGESLILHLDSKGIAASTGSACSSTKLEASHVLLAIGLEKEEAHGSLRISLGIENTEEDIDYAITAIKEVVEKLRKMSPLWCASGT